jgi:hypothetical protein
VKRPAAMLPEPATATTGGPKARADQLNVQPWEQGLVALARVHHPTVAWWHGYREIKGAYWSYCYVCDTRITEVAGMGNPSMAVRQVIDNHKNLHRAGVIPGGSPKRKEAPKQ